MQLGIVGLPLSGKTTIFNALTRGQASTASHPAGKLEVHTASVDVPDARLETLNEMFKRPKAIHAKVQYSDIAGLTGRTEDTTAGRVTLDGNLLNQIVQNDALLHVLRAFENPAVPHPAGSVNPRRDLDDLDTELILSDLGVIERRLERIKASLSKGGGTPVEREAHKKEQALLQHFKTHLESSAPLRDLTIALEDANLLKSLALTTLKPTLVVLNTGEERGSQPLALDYKHRHTAVVELQGEIEMELAQLPPEDAREFLKAYGIGEPGLARIIRESYKLLGLHSFFTIGEEEVRAWTLPVGANALAAAGTVHTDFARGFIRAEVIHYDDLIACGGMPEARKRGLLRLEGKEYVVKDGDVIQIRFSV
jgi:GTP-binding protein YchF